MAERRPKGSGTLRYRGEKWHAEIRIQTALGKKVVRGIFRTKRAADQWCKAMKASAGPYASDPTASLTPLVERWVKAHCEGVEPNTSRALRYYVKLAKPATDALTLADSVQPMRVDECLRAIPDLTTYQRKRVFETVRQFYHWCVRMGELTMNPMMSLKAPKHTPKPPNPFSQQQCRAFIDAVASHRLGSLMIVVLTCAIRPGEAFGLQWESVDLEKGTFLVESSLEDVEGKLRLKEPKTKGSRRTITLPRVAREALEDHASKGGRTGYVWKNVRGGPLRRANFDTHVYKPILREAKLPIVRIYDLRHSGLTVMLLTTKNLRRVSSVAGHASSTTTLRTYAHLVDIEDDRFSEQVDAAFDTKPAESVQNSVRRKKAAKAKMAVTRAPRKRSGDSQK